MELSINNINLNTNTIQYTLDKTVVDAFDEKQRKLQKQREKRELEERREQKERVKEILEAYAKYRRELRHYYNELGYQKKLAASLDSMGMFVDIKKPAVVSEVYEAMMLLGM